MSKFTTEAQVISGNALLVDEANPTHELGELAVTTDGRRFRYAQAGASNLVVGNLLQSPAEATGDQNLAVAAAAIGATSITTTSTVTVTANQYGGGYVVVTVTPGLGQIFRIKSHPAATAAAVVLTLEDPIQTALTTVSRIDLVNNPYDGVIQMPGTRSSCVVGVAVNDITASQYGWIQVGGVANVLSNGALTVGSAIVAADNAGAVEVGANGTTEAFAPVGRAVTGVASGENGAVYLSLS